MAQGPETGFRARILEFRHWGSQTVAVSPEPQRHEESSEREAGQ